MHRRCTWLPKRGVSARLPASEMRCLVSQSPALISSASTTTLRPPSKLPTTTIWSVSRPAPSFRRLKLRRPPDETAALSPRCLVVRAQRKPCRRLDEPNHFVEEFQTIEGRWFKIRGRRPKKKKFYFPSDLRVPNDEVLNALFHVCCRFASEAVIMASQLVDSGRLTATGLSTKICGDTVQATLGTYVDVFLNISKDCCKKRFGRDTVIRFVGALRGLGSISHILLEDALEALNHIDPREGLLEYTFNSDVKRIHRNFNCKMDDLENGIRNQRTDPIEVAFPTIDEGVEVTGSFLDLMLARRQRTLEKACGGSK